MPGFRREEFKPPCLGKTAGTAAEFLNFSTNFTWPTMILPEIDQKNSRFDERLHSVAGDGGDDIARSQVITTYMFLTPNPNRRTAPRRNWRRDDPRRQLGLLLAVANWIYAAN